MERTEADRSTLQLELQPDQINRLWQHGMHEERLFHDRLNYFSAVEAGLLGVFAILYHKEASPGMYVPLTAVGLAFALLWLRVQVRHWRYCVHVNERIKRTVPEYLQTTAGLPDSWLPDRQMGCRSPGRWCSPCRFCGLLAHLASDTPHPYPPAPSSEDYPCGSRSRNSRPRSVALWSVGRMR